ncbi:hypothetical protein ANO11243_095640 [Dothideomycetidae sp. 11243]|nr:hypothetical protein ANO11243_095640 [fungal sp. No.11243]
MSASLDASSASNPSNLPSRYQIRRLTPEHLQWAIAIVCHSNLYHSTVWTRLYPGKQGKRFNFAMEAAKYLCEHQINSGKSIGVFDLEYQYEHESSRAKGGAFLWDPKNDDVIGEELLAAMDFPLVSVALAYDAADPIDPKGVAPMVEAFPAFGYVYSTLNKLDPGSESRKATGRNQILMRNATSTRADYENRKLMGSLARFMMREAQQSGYRGINIEALSDAVTHVWTNPKQKGMRGELVCKFWTLDAEEVDEQGKTFKPFSPAEQMVTRCFVHLNENDEA